MSCQILTQQISYGQDDLTTDRRQSKTLILSTNVDQKSLQTEFSIAISRLTGHQWHSKTLFLSIFDPCASIVKSILDSPLSGVDLFDMTFYMSRNSLVNKVLSG